jgi:serine/threonine protein kinase
VAAVYWHHAVQVCFVCQCFATHCDRLPAAVNVVCWLSQLLHTLQVLHNAGRVHRDIRPDNLVFVKDSHNPATLRLLVIDWAYSCPRNSEELYNGATHFVSPAVAKHLLDRQLSAACRTFVFTAGDDLYSWLLVCVWMHALHHLTYVFATLEREYRHDPILARKQRAIGQVFNRYLESSMWRPLRDAVLRHMGNDRRASSRGEMLAVDYRDLYELINIARQEDFEFHAGMNG